MKSRPRRDRHPLRGRDEVGADQDRDEGRHDEVVILDTSVRAGVGSDRASAGPWLRARAGAEGEEGGDRETQATRGQVPPILGPGGPTGRRCRGRPRPRTTTTPRPRIATAQQSDLDGPESEAPGPGPWRTWSIAITLTTCESAGRMGRRVSARTAPSVSRANPLRSDLRQLVALAGPRESRALASGSSLKVSVVGVPDELAAELVGDVAEVAGVGRAVGDLDVARSGACGVLRQSRKFATCAGWPSSLALNFSAFSSILRSGRSPWTSLMP